MNFIDRITDGLETYEIITLVFGSLLFFILLILLVVFVIQKRRLKPLLLFFALSVLMLVWPSLQKIKIDTSGAELETKTKELAANPTPEKEKEVKELMENLKERGVKNPLVRKNIAIAEFLVGNVEDSKATIEALPENEKNDKMIKDITTSIKTTADLKTQLLVVDQDKNDSIKVQHLNDLKHQAMELKVKNKQVDSGILHADEKIMQFKKVNPRVQMKTPFVRRTK